MKGSRPKPPADVRRKLRREACYGCCKCGHPIYQYHHIIEYSSEQHFRPKDMMVLCPNHHDEATNGVIGESVQRALKANPFNRVHKHAAGQLVMDRPRAGHLILGGSRFVVGPGVLVVIHDVPVLTVNHEGTSILLSACIYDADGNLLVRIDENEWESYDPMPWDIEFHYRKLMVRSAERELSLNVDATSDPLVITGQFRTSSATLQITPTRITNGPATLTGHGTIICKQIKLEHQTGIVLTPVDHPVHIPKIKPNVPCWCGSGLKFKRCHGPNTPR